MEFKLNGKSIKPSVPLDINRVIKLLDKMPYLELIDLIALADKINYNDKSTLRDKLKTHAKDNFVKGAKNILLFGSKKTIKEYKKQAGL